MQEQYRDGSVGPVKPFDLDEMRKALNDPEVDSVKVISKKDQIDKAKIFAPQEGLVVYETSVRQSWRGNNEPLEDYITPEVEEYIREHNLYR